MGDQHGSLFAPVLAPGSIYQQALLFAAFLYVEPVLGRIGRFKAIKRSDR